MTLYRYFYGHANEACGCRILIVLRIYKGLYCKTQGEPYSSFFK